MWFASIEYNIYDNIYLSMNPFYRTGTAVESYILANGGANDVEQINYIRHQEKFGAYGVLNASVGKNWSIARRYTLGFSLQMRNLLNNQDIRTGGYEQMRMYRSRTADGTFYTRFPSKYFYLLGTTYYLNVYFRF